MRSVLALAVTLATFGAAAQDYPSKPIVIVVPAAAGGPTDTLTRVLAQAMGHVMKNQLIIENAGGAGGIIGIDAAAKSPAEYNSMPATLRCVAGSVPRYLVTPSSARCIAQTRACSHRGATSPKVRLRC